MWDSLPWKWDSEVKAERDGRDIETEVRVREAEESVTVAGGGEMADSIPGVIEIEGEVAWGFAQLNVMSAQVDGGQVVEINDNQVPELTIIARKLDQEKQGNVVK